MSGFIGVIGPGIVGMPMAALLAQAAMRRGSGRVMVVQRNSANSGWKVDAINEGRSPIGGVEPALDAIVSATARAGFLSASHDIAALADAELVLVCVQTDKRGLAPDYEPLDAALDGLASAFTARHAGLPAPMVSIESTLAPSSMTTYVRERFAAKGLVEGRDVHLGNSPNRVMPGRLVERVASSDKLVAGLSRATAEAIATRYRDVVTDGTLHVTNSLTAEIVKTLENAYRDVRIAFAAEVVRWCDEQDVDFYSLRDAVNAQVGQEDAASRDPGVIPSGALLVPTVGVGGHCLPKDGILLWWRLLERDDSAARRSLILEARRINDESPQRLLQMAESRFGTLRGQKVAVLGAAYRPDSEDTRNSPSLRLVELLRDAGAELRLHDPYVRAHDQNLVSRKLDAYFTNDAAQALTDAEFVFVATAHAVYRRDLVALRAAAPRCRGLVDGCNLYDAAGVTAWGVDSVGIGRGRRAPDAPLVEAVVAQFRRVEIAVAREVAFVVESLNANYATDAFSRATEAEVRRLAGTCVTGCQLPDPTSVPPQMPTHPLATRLAAMLRN
jgi:UDP-N-acetyl-D-mannosaminuronic acid dehydrogenase